MLTRILLLLCVALNAPLASAKETLHIYAASSMTNAVNALVADYSQQHDVKLVTVYGGSSSLARQIEAGAPADLFISANEEWANYLVEKGLVKPNKVVTLAANSLVLIRPTAQPWQVLSCKMPRLGKRPWPILAWRLRKWMRCLRACMPSKRYNMRGCGLSWNHALRKPITCVWR